MCVCVCVCVSGLSLWRSHQEKQEHVNAPIDSFKLWPERSVSLQGACALQTPAPTHGADLNVCVCVCVTPVPTHGADLNVCVQKTQASGMGLFCSAPGVRERMQLKLVPCDRD